MESALFLRNLWYFAVHGGGLPERKLLQLSILGEKIVFGRDASGKPFALRDNCPHRGVPLSEGKFDGETIACCYHGWQFDCSGVCRKIPALGQAMAQPGKIRAYSYPCEEVNGTIWVYMAQNPDKPAGPVPPPPDLWLAAGEKYLHVERTLLQADIDHATVGLIDPAHVTFVHQSWFWRSRNSAKLKEKAFEPVGKGFRMKRHSPNASASGKGYGLLGGPISTEITFQLPGHRFEHIQVGETDFIASLTFLTPVDSKTTELNHVFFSSLRWVKYLWWPLVHLGRTFICQDVKVFRKLQKGLESNPKLMLIGDPDAQARWYFELKRQWARAQESDVAFENPLSPATLRWVT
ncbi:MAG: aromatic ring-hydroxylating dioxygenase subunit alpha [Verrucomicrobia bacterium]|nr:aromatic ring-hydroxylating dioxygenase subunit alpha [Verrucomicrobiota bacterium]